VSIESHFFILIDPDYLLDDTRADRMMTADAYVQEVRSVINNLVQSQVGGAVLHTIKLWKKGVRIAPVKASAADFCGLETSDGGFIEAKDDFYNRHLLPWVRWTDPDAPPFKSAVRFIPRLDMSRPQCTKFFGDPAKADFLPTPESVLIHELTHCIRHSTFTEDGAQPDLKLGSGTMTHTESGEEFNAILVENMFQSEKKANIRFSHKDFHTLDDGLRDSFEYFRISKNAFGTVERFCRSNPFFTGRLSKLKVPFNPIAAFLKDPRKCREMSAVSAF
jgi:hypothetical protein